MAERHSSNHVAFQGKKISIPSDSSIQPSWEALQQHQRESGLNC